MRIVQVGKFYPPEYQGGLESVVAGINDELVRRGIGVTAVVAAIGSPGRDRYHGVDVVRVRTFGDILSQPISPGFPAAVRRAPGDLLHLHHPNPLGDIAILSDARPLVITQHSDIVRQRILAPAYMPLLRGAFARARRIAVGSEQLLRTSSELKGFEAKVRVIPYGIDPAGFALTDTVRHRVAELREAWKHERIVLAVGRLVGYKGFDVLIEAMRGVDATLVIVGKGPEEAKLKALATSHQRPATSCIFAGRVSDEDLVAYYHACDVFCLPSVSIAEAFGMVLVEAMACGKPLVSTALPTGVSAVNRHGDTGFVVPPRDAAALRAAVSQLIGDDALRDRMGRTAMAVQAAEYTAALMGERYVRLYEEALA